MLFSNLIKFMERTIRYTVKKIYYFHKIFEHTLNLSNFKSEFFELNNKQNGASLDKCVIALVDKYVIAIGM